MSLTIINFSTLWFCLGAPYVRNSIAANMRIQNWFEKMKFHGETYAYAYAYERWHWMKHVSRIGKKASIHATLRLRFSCFHHDESIAKYTGHVITKYETLFSASGAKLWKNATFWSLQIRYKCVRFLYVCEYRVSPKKYALSHEKVHIYMNLLTWRQDLAF